MKSSKIFIGFIGVLASCITLTAFQKPEQAASFISFPYKKAGLTERQAAAHLLDRFTYGAKPGQIDEVVKMGIEKWFEAQLAANLNDDGLNKRLTGYDALNLSNTQVAATYLRNNELLRLAVEKGFVKKDSVKNADIGEYRAILEKYMKANGLKPRQELFRQFTNQKILRASYSNNQLQEVLTDFWFNHFNVSISKQQCAEFIPAYERDVIRPNVLGKFNTLLLATAKSPAMLFYLDNFSSSGMNTPDRLMPDMQQQTAGIRSLQGRNSKLNADQQAKLVARLQNAKKKLGLNENYAREVMELHTLGVDGGYTQQDVTQAAKVLTGWTVYPMGAYGNGGVQKVIENLDEGIMAKRGFVHDKDFLFIPNRHDNSEKMVLGKKFAAGGGYEEGEQLLSMLAHHASTAKFITKKLATRFVADNPPQSLIDKMAATFTAQDGDISAVLITMVNAPEFWSAEAIREKTKSPFELAISAVRGLNANVLQPNQLYTWITKMGQKLYYYQAPTGFPDNGQYWINSGALLNRMNFGLSLAAQRIPGVIINLKALNDNHEPESAEAALSTYAKLIMPERSLEQTVKRLTPMLNDKDLIKKIDDAAAQKNAAQDKMMMGGEDDVLMADNKPKPAVKRVANQVTDPNYTMLAQVVGVILGSPEFQRK